MSSAPTPSSSQQPPYPYAHFDIANGIPIGVGALARVLRVAYCPPPPSSSPSSSAAASTSPLSSRPRVTVACKILSKLQLLQMKKVEAVMREKGVLLALGPHPLIARLYGTHQSEDELFFFMEEMTRGDLQEHISQIVKARGRQRIFTSPSLTSCPSSHAPSSTLASSPPLPSPPNAASSAASSSLSSTAFLNGLFCLSFKDLRLITAQLVLALEHCHTNVNKKHASRYTLRDLKSENVCFDSEGRCVLIDFDCVDECRGLVPETNYGDALGETVRANESDAAAALRRKSISEIQESRKMSAYNFCGTAQFVSPEVLGQLKWSYSSDLWALGVIVYHMLFGRYPFNGDMPFLTMKEIIRGLTDGHFPAAWSEEAKGAVVLEEEVGEGEGDGGVGEEDSISPPTTSKSACASPPPPPSPLYSIEQYSLVRLFIEGVLVIDPTRRLGVGQEDKKASGLFLEPCYADLMQHPLFTSHTRSYENSSNGHKRKRSILPPLDWDDLRARLGLASTSAATAGDETVSLSTATTKPRRYPPYVFKTLAQRYQEEMEGQHRRGGGGASEEGDASDASSPQHPILSLYDDPPFHSDDYSSHGDEVETVAGPLESFLLNGPTTQKQAPLNSEGDAAENKDAVCGTACAVDLSNTDTGASQGHAVCDLGADSPAAAADLTTLKEWIINTWGAEYFSDLANFDKTKKRGGGEAEALSSQSCDTAATSEAAVMASIAAANTRALLLTDAVVTEAMANTNTISTLTQLKRHWEWCTESLRRLNCADGGAAVRVDSDVTLLRVRPTCLLTLTAEKRYTDRLLYSVLEASATRLAKRAAEADAAATRAYLESVKAANEERRAKGIAVPLGVNNPYAPYANAPIVIRDLQAEIREASRIKGGDDEEDDVIDDVGVDKHGLLKRPDEDFSK